jgi:FAD/FMN-containing dehydrogenase
LKPILAYCARSGRHATFRAGGTSMNGQSQSDDILIDVRRHWAGMVVENGGAQLRARPGPLRGRSVLHGRKGVKSDAFSSAWHGSSV